MSCSNLQLSLSPHPASPIHPLGEHTLTKKCVTPSAFSRQNKTLRLHLHVDQNYALTTSTSSEFPHLQSSICVVLHYILVLHVMCQVLFSTFCCQISLFICSGGALFVLLVSDANIHILANTSGWCLQHLTTAMFLFIPSSFIFRFFFLVVGQPVNKCFGGEKTHLQAMLVRFNRDKGKHS